MYRGSDPKLSRIHHAELLEEAARTRADREARSPAANRAARWLTLVLTAAAIVALCIVWVWTAH